MVKKLWHKFCDKETIEEYCVCSGKLCYYRYDYLKVHPRLKKTAHWKGGQFWGMVQDCYEEKKSEPIEVSKFLSHKDD